MDDECVRSREPYVYHNILSNTKYLARLIAGDFVFTETPFVARRMPDPEARAVQFAENAFAGNADVVAHVAASSLPPDLDEQYLSRLRAILIETYESGTFPTGNDHRFKATLGRVAKARLPVFLSSHNGIDLGQLYQCELVNDLGIPVYRIDNLIPETALPLLQLAAEQVVKSDDQLRGRELGDAIRGQMLRIVMMTQKRTSQLLDHTRIVRIDEEVPRA